MIATRILGLSSVAIIGIAMAPAAKAQEINYTALTEMFGQPVTTSATGSPQTVSQVPANMQIISADDIRRSGATNIPDILRFIAGIDVRSYGALDSDVSIRGIDQPLNPRLLVLINGRQVYLDDYGYTAWQNLPVELPEIRQIEIVRGPASALFGFNATSGVINIITYDPLFDKTDVLQLSAGSDGTYQGSLVATAQEPGKAGIRIAIGGLKTEEYKIYSGLPGHEPFDTSPHLGNYNIDARYKPTDHTEVTLEVTQSQASSIIDTPLIEYSHASYRNNSIKSSIAGDTSLGLLTLLAYMNTAKASYDGIGDGSEYGTNQVAVVQASDLFKIADNHAIRLALEYRDNRDYGTVVDGGIGYQNYAASAMWNWQVVPELSFTAAGRVDHLVLQRSDPFSDADKYTAADFNGYSFTVPSYNLGVVYQPTASDTIRLLTGRAVQAPTLIDYGADVQFPLGPINILLAGRPDLRPSISTNYEIDYDRQLSALSSVLSTAVYYNVTQDLLETGGELPFVFNGTTLQGYSQNIGHATEVGSEIGIQNDDTTDWRWKFSYSLAAVRQKLISEPPVVPYNFNSASPVSIVDFGLGYSWRKLEADFDGRWQSRYQDFIDGPKGAGAPFLTVNIRNYVTLSARLGYQLTPSLNLAISGDQLPAAQTIETAGLEPERRVLVTATFGF